MIDDVTLPMAMPAIPKTGNPAALRAAAEEFEGVFLAQMLAPMFTAIAAEAPFGGGHAEETWRSLQIEEFGKAIARAGGIGLADHVYREMLALQEGAGR
ncbi:MAG: rod-binding protein [Rhodospirillales bacterium]|jgi:Rod binding domain-containing protein|nr:rod-binding protein [Rhodospirillales bacterium]